MNMATSIAPVRNQAVAISIVARGADSACGCPCCCSVGTMQFPPQYFIPSQCINMISKEEVNQFVMEANQILSTTHMPILPIVFMHFCIPCSPLCIMAAYSSIRQSNLRGLCRRWNEKTLVSRGCHVEIVSAATATPAFGRDAADGGLCIQFIIDPCAVGFQLLVPQQQQMAPSSYHPEPAYQPEPTAYGVPSYSAVPSIVSQPYGILPQQQTTAVYTTAVYIK